MISGTEIINKLQTALQLPLPGEKARALMSPPYRPNLNLEQILANDPKIGGVMLLLYQKAGELHIVFTQRRAYDGVHGGQMSFPGGKKDLVDTDTIQTALRETQEEIGIPPSQIEVIGKLSELYIPPSNFLVYPVVGFAKKETTFIPQEKEVEKIVEIPLSFFQQEVNINLQTEIKLYNGTTVRVPAYTYQQHIIWGATAIMLSEFMYIYKHLD